MLILSVSFRYGIRCNAVLPGFIETSMTAGIPAHIRETVRTNSFILFNI